MGSILQGKTIGDEIIERKRLVKNPPHDDIIKEVAKAFGIDEEGIKKKGKRDNLARLVAIYLVHVTKVFWRKLSKLVMTVNSTFKT